jgi:hypothetical protein
MSSTLSEEAKLPGIHNASVPEAANLHDDILPANSTSNRRHHTKHHKMSLLRPSIAGRILRAGVPATQRFAPGTVQWDSQTAVGTPLTVSDKALPEAGLAVEEKQKDAPVRYNHPDYTAEVDQASSFVNPFYQHA